MHLGGNHSWVPLIQVAGIALLCDVVNARLANYQLRYLPIEFLN